MLCVIWLMFYSRACALHYLRYSLHGFLTFSRHALPSSPNLWMYVPCLVFYDPGDGLLYCQYFISYRFFVCLMMFLWASYCGRCNSCFRALCFVSAFHTFTGGVCQGMYLVYCSTYFRVWICMRKDISMLCSVHVDVDADVHTDVKICTCSCPCAFSCTWAGTPTVGRTPTPTSSFTPTPTSTATSTSMSLFYFSYVWHFVASSIPLHFLIFHML